MATLLPGHLAAALITAAIITLGAYFYLYQVDIAIAKWKPDEWQWKVVIRHSEVRPRDIDRIRRIFIKGEDEILWASHRHIVHLLLRIWLPGLLAVGFAVLAVALGNLRIPLPQHSKAAAQIRHTITAQGAVNLPSVKKGTKPTGGTRQINIKKPGWLHWPKAITIPWWVWLWPSGIFLLFALMLWVAWTSWYILVTNKRLIVLERPFAAFPFMEGDDKPFFLSDVKNAEVSGSLFRRRWGMAVMDVSTYLQPEEDGAIKNIWGLPHVENVAELVNRLVQENKSTMEGVPDPVFGDLTQEVRKLRLAVEPLARRFGTGNTPDE